jgi:glycosyltransferase involved in cell wall biosynthesis
MISAMESARAAGADIAPLDFWRREADFDVLHLWGLALEHSYTVKWAHAGGKKIMISALVNYPGWKSKLKHLASLAIGKARLIGPMLKVLDCITVVNKGQAEYIVNTLGFPGEKVTVVPNMVDDIFFGVGAAGEVSAIGTRDYVICAGNVCSRKNQLSLVYACRKLGVPLLLVGRVLPGEEDYGRAVAEAMKSGDGFVWIPWLTPGSAELASAYRGAAVFALPSINEQQPISALEAAAARKPLVLADMPYARQEFYENAALVDPRSVDSIAGALRRALDRPDAHCPPRSVIEQCRKEKVGAAYMAIYKRLVQGTC